jgi:4-diphosphocytidyl-2C-methyl-D-erythritol kinase
VEEIGKLLKDSTSGLTLPSPGDALGGLGSGTRDAADRLKQMAPAAQTMVTGRNLCPVAANGGPDCKAAADQLCKGKGFSEGRGVDIESAQKCSAKAYFSGQGACQTENFVTRAVCQ